MTESFTAFDCVCIDHIAADADPVSGVRRTDAGEGDEQNEDGPVLSGTRGAAFGGQSACRESQAGQHPQTVENIAGRDGPGLAPTRIPHTFVAQKL